MKTYYQITCELYTEHVVPVINAKQYDSGRGVDITLTDCGAVVVPAVSDVCNLYCKKSDGTVSYISGTVNGSAVRVDFTNTLLAEAGVVECELEVTSGADTVSTPVFRMVVLPSNYDPIAIESQDEFTALETALQTVSSYDGRITALESITAGLSTVISDTLTTATPCGNSSFLNAASIAHDVGTYVVFGYVSFDANSSGARSMVITSSSTGTSAIVTSARARVAPVAGFETTFGCSGLIKATAAGTWYLRAWQGSGASLDVTGAQLTAVKLSD